jgi:hypothetical protein
LNTVFVLLEELRGRAGFQRTRCFIVGFGAGERVLAKAKIIH